MKRTRCNKIKDIIDIDYLRNLQLLNEKKEDSWNNGDNRYENNSVLPHIITHRASSNFVYQNFSIVIIIISCYPFVFPSRLLYLIIVPTKRINDKRSWIWTFARNIIHQRKRQENNKSKVPRCVVNGAQFSKNVSTNFRVGGGSVIVNVITMIFVRSDYDNLINDTHIASNNDKFFE